MRRFLAPILFGVLAGVALASPATLCEPDLIGADDITFRVRQLVNPPGYGLYTSESQAVQCVTAPYTINCVVGHLVSLRDVDTGATDDEPCENYSIACGQESTIVTSLDWGRIPAGHYEYLSYWQLGGCNADGVVDAASTVEIVVD